MARHAGRPWEFDPAVMHSHMDAFLQRCRDLREVCEVRLLFSPGTPLPVFGGSRGPEVEKALLDIQASFAALLGQLRGLSYDVLDIKATQ